MKKQHNIIKIISIILLVWWAGFGLEKAEGGILDKNGHLSETLLKVFRYFAPLLQECETVSSAEKNRILDPKTPVRTISLQTLDTVAQTVFLRPKGVERFQLGGNPFNNTFLSYDKPEIRQLFKDLGNIDAVYPSGQPFRYILLNGATVSAMERRVKTFIEMVESGKIALHERVQVVFLTGARDLENDEKKKMASEPALHTEYDAAKWIWTQQALPSALRDVPITFVNAPKKADGQRPDTLGTVEAWLAQKPEPGHCLSFSNQPFVDYQELIIRLAFRKAGLEAKGFTVEGVGSAATDDVLLSVLVDNLARTIHSTVLEQTLP